MSSRQRTCGRTGAVDQLVGSWRLTRLIGQGAFGEVWEARHHVLDNRFAATKIAVEATYVRLLRQEAIAVDCLDHPNVVTLLDVDPYADPPHLVMELVQGASLERVMDFSPIESLRS